MNKGFFILLIATSILLLLSAISVQAVGAQQSRFYTTEAVDISNKNETFSFQCPGQTFVSFSLMFVDSVSKHGGWTRNDLEVLRGAKLAIRKIHDSMPIDGTLPRYDEKGFERREQLIKQHGAAKGSRIFANEWMKPHLKAGKIVSLEKQRMEVWKVIKSLQGKLSRFDQFKAAFLIAIANRIGLIEMLADPTVAAELGLKSNEIEKIRKSCKLAAQSWNQKLTATKLAESKHVWNVLNKNQQQTYLRLLGKTERAFLEVHTKTGVENLVGEWRGNAIDKVVDYYDAADIMFRSQTVNKIVNHVNQGLGFQLSKEELEQVTRLLRQAESGQRAKFQTKDAHHAWLKFRINKLDALEKYFKQKKGDSHEKLIQLIENLRKEVSIFRQGNEPKLVDLRPKEPMIFYLVEHEKLDDSADRLTIFGKRNAIPKDNYFPLLLRDPYPKNVFPNRPVDEDDLFHQQSIKLRKLASEWAKERRHERDYSRLVQINNRYLMKTKEVMLPHQYGETFRYFFQKAGFIAMFHYYDVAKKFRMSDLQRIKLRETASQAAINLEMADRILKEAVLATVFSNMPNNVKSNFQKLTRCSQAEWFQLHVPSRNEKQFYSELNSTGKNFRGIRLYKNPFDTGER